MKIMICGLTGTGKTTICKAVAEALNYEYLHSSKMFREFAGVDKKSQSFWTHKEGQKFIDERLETDIDERFDKYLLSIIDKKDNFVTDSWTMPWLYNDTCVRIYLKCPFSVRVNRVMLRDKLNEDEAKQAVKKKDVDTRKIYLQKYCFDIVKDIENFDLIVNTHYFTKKEIILFILNFIKSVERYYQ